MRYLTIDVEGIESFNDKCNQLAKQGGTPVGEIQVMNTGMAIKMASGPTLINRYIQQWSLPDSPGPDSNVSTVEL